MSEQAANAHHREIAREIKKRAAQVGAPFERAGWSYIGTTKPCYLIKSEIVGQLGRDWLRRHPELTPAEYVALLNSLSRGETSNEYMFIGYLLERLPKLRKTLDPNCLNDWLERAEGWAEVDCQAEFSADELLSNWQAWKRLFISLRASENIHKRRASLVFLTRPVRESADARLANLAFANIEKLKHEKHILTTKAVSWLLRDLIKHHRAQVEACLQDNADTLPKVAVRETRNKLKSGRKSGH